MRKRAYSKILPFLFILQFVPGFSMAEDIAIGSETIDKLMGEWEGAMTFPTTKLGIIWRFEKNERGEIIGSMGRYIQEIASVQMRNLLITNTNISFDIPGGSYSGKILDNRISGQWDEGKLVPMDMTKKEVVELSRESMERLEGVWTGRANSTNLEFQFSISENRLEGALDTRRFLGLGPKDLLVIDITLEGNELSLRVPRLQGEYVAILSEREAKGVFTYEGEAYSLTITRSDI